MIYVLKKKSRAFLIEILLKKISEMRNRKEQVIERSDQLFFKYESFLEPVQNL